MSVVTTAIIAGATAALTDVANDAISVLYAKLKSLIKDVADDFRFEEIENSPNDASAREAVEEHVSQSGIDNSEEIKSLAEELVREALAENSGLSRAALVDIRELAVRDDIVFENMNLDGPVIRGEKWESREGGFRFEGSTDRRDETPAEKGQSPTVSVGSITAKESNIITSIFYSIPKKIRLVILSILAVVVLIFSFQIIMKTIDDRNRRESFDNAFRTALSSNEGSEYSSSVNYALNTIPNAIRRTRDSDHWNRFNYSWNKHIDRIERFYSEISSGLANGSMLPGDEKESVCNQVTNILGSHYDIRRRIETVVGIGITEGGADGGVLHALGPVINVPDTSNLENVYAKGCDGILSTLKNPPDTRTEEEKKADEIATLEAFIEETSALKALDLEAEASRTIDQFIGTYAGFLINRGMYGPDARAEARVALQEVLDGGGYHYEIPGMNDIVDRISFIRRLANRDLDSELAALEQRLQELKAD
ncbi:hypothetical protein SAMN04487972_12017 [Paracoccus halophilus]|uniref:Uncharacterized protein n=1 Tax=Paracoccus halophilus TaxID=376733 RepID=A0A099EXW0_9RHOB|nr:hypothetical protein [Paracoccus halophilus]KGJ03285.1 hypothetical protein IT41_14635 [Paracoccus halophilus]SFA58316.1 hypothetical protein SAMN04487972_12017 [Paracoccus halophilus]